MRLFKFYSVIAACCLVLGACSKKDEKFHLVPSGHSGVTFRNVLHENVEFNILNYLYFYNGGGVSVGDVNGDDLVDIYFTANQEPNKLYLNQGDFKFKDVTEQAGVAGVNGWTTGVTMADVNADGLLDIYVSYLGDYLIYKGKNQLFINEGNDANGIPKFTDRAIDYGLDLVGFSTQASFFDYDRDGDLDMFMLTHSVHQNGTHGKSSLRKQHHPLAGDRLLRNDNGKFIDVTDDAGIYNSVIGYGLGIVVSDVNLDGWPDIYVGNDFHENDYLYINNGDGTFKEQLESQMQHTSRYTMGVDFADFNNDLFPDLISMDMLSEDPYVQKSAMAEDPYDVYQYKISFGYNNQYSRNALQINNQNGTFSDIALQAGVSATDWSWSTLFADFDLNGKKDIFITNGIQRRFNDLDYINFMSADTIRMKIEGDAMMTDREMQYIDKMPKVKIQNYLFVNNGDSTFSNKTLDWGMDKPSYSQGAAYADLDNDGDLDLVVNNIEDEAFLYENKTIKKDKATKDIANHYLKIKLKGKTGNQFGIGAKVLLYAGAEKQMQECMPTRGFQSSVDTRLTFGVGPATKVDSILVIWSDGSYQRLQNVSTDQQLILDQQQSSGNFDYSIFHSHNQILRNSTDDLAIPYRHIENSFVEFVREGLLPQMMSAEGPASAVGDINNDGLEDLFLGGAKWKEGRIFVQTKDGKFKRTSQPAIENDSISEDVDATFFNADNDSDNDLLVVSGGNEFSGQSKHIKPRLYLNDGKGNLTASNGVPDIFITGSCVSVNDVDRDGDGDLFIGARSIPWQYGIKPDSYLLLNDGKGNFTDATDAVAPALRKFGFVKNATWADMDGDGNKELIIAAEWSPITIFQNKNGKLTPLVLQGSGLEQTNGWWNVIKAFDVDGDGDLDLVAGNLGKNSKLHASPNEPVKMYVSDFDNNDSTDQVLTYYTKGKEYPFHTRDEMTKQMPYLKKRYLSYHKFAETGFHEMFADDELKKAEQYVAYTFETALIENLGGGKFKVKPLGKASQFSTANAIEIDDVNKDGKIDIMLAGNFYPINIQMGRYDASYGLLLQGDGKGNFKPIPAVQSGFSVSGETRSLRKIIVGGKIHYVTVRNNDSIQAFTLK